MANVGNESLVELGLFNLGYRYEVSPSFMLADNGGHGFTVNARTSLSIVSLSGNYRRLWRDDPVNTSDQPVLLGDAFESHSVSASAPFLGGSLSYRYSFNRNSNSRSDTSDDSVTRTNSLDYRVGLFRALDYNLDMTASYSQSGDDRVGLAEL